VKRLVKKMFKRLGYDLVRGDRVAFEIIRSSPPKVPDECQTGPPDFVGIGAQKCGTSWWFDLILQHPNIYNPKHMIGVVSPHYLVKERHFFDRFFTDEFTDDQIDEYCMWFPRVEGKLAGEWTPRYLIDHWVAPLLKSVAPDAKLLVMLRDPIDRFVSGMSHLQRLQQLHPNHAIEQFARGRYYEQLREWLHFYSSNQILVLQYELCVAHPNSELERTYRFLEVDESWKVDWSAITRKVNVARPKTRFDLPTAHLKLLIERYSDDVKNMAKTYNIDLSLWPNFCHL
jgi:hypothetical protein